ncbi:MAG: cytochrome c [Deltaproteobacteria bacterium]|nr:cytochrome c [Deltaproteobacteria bacterium]
MVPSTGKAADEDAVKLFKSKCASCHAADGTGKSKQGEKLKVRDMASEDFQKGTDDDWKKSIMEGIKDKKKPAMKEKLTPEQVDLLIKYVRTFKK